MKVAIQARPRSFSERWIDFCRERNIAYKLVNCYENDIIEQLADCDCLLWHHSHGSYRDVLFAKQILFAIEHSGKAVFPDFKTHWHFDDKIGQKYLLESVGAPFVKTYIFYDRQSALNWASYTNYPKVFKLKNGAGASNVRLIHTRKEAKKIISKCFSVGFKRFSAWNNLKEKLRLMKQGRATIWEIVKGVGRLIIKADSNSMLAREKGYAYFQDFVPNNTYDIRVIVIKDRAFAIKRFVRKNDFRASGSGEIDFHRDSIPNECIKIAFNVNEVVRAQSLALDFVFDENQSPLIVELSYGFSAEPYDNCPGYWDKELRFIEGHFNPQYWMIENLISQINSIH